MMLSFIVVFNVGSQFPVCKIYNGHSNFWGTGVGCLGFLQRKVYSLPCRNDNHGIIYLNLFCTLINLSCNFGKTSLLRNCNNKGIDSMIESLFCQCSNWQNRHDDMEYDNWLLVVPLKCSYNVLHQRSRTSQAASKILNRETRI